MLVTVGGFDPHNTVEGKDALFNMWDYVLSIGDLRKVNCNTKGNLLTMNNMAIGGPAALSFKMYLVIVVSTVKSLPISCRIN